MYRLFVDTENYSGDFVRDFTYYTTGTTGDCDVVSSLADTARDAMVHAQWWEEHLIEQRSANRDDRRTQIATIAPTPGWFNNGYGQHFRVDSDEASKIETRCDAYMSVLLTTDVLPPNNVLEEFQQRAIAFCEDVFPTLRPELKTIITLTGVRQELPRKRARHKL